MTCSMRTTLAIVRHSRLARERDSLLFGCASTSIILMNASLVTILFYAVQARRAAAAPKLADTSSAAAGLPAGLARASSSGGGASTNLVGLLQDAKRVIEPERARIVEDTGDTVRSR